MALTLTLDYQLPVVAEPGYYEKVTSRRFAEAGSPADQISQQGLWTDPASKVLMLRPLQLDPSWINTPQQVDSIVRLADLQVNASDLSSGSIFEAPVFGNADSPWIYHVPVGPVGSFLGITPVALTGVLTHIVATVTDALIQVAPFIFQPSATMPATPPTITQIGDTGDGRFLAHSVAKQAANQALYLRWFHPKTAFGFEATHEFYIGQFKLRIQDVNVEIFRDTSAGGDRSAWKKVMVAPLFNPGHGDSIATGVVMPLLTSYGKEQDSERGLLWLPYCHNQVLLYASSGKWVVLTVNGAPKRLADNSDWDIVRSDTVMVWVLSPVAGRFQIQRVKYPPMTLQAQMPPVALDYTPSSGIVVTLNTDTDHGSSIVKVGSVPPSYSIPANDASDCPKPTTTSTDKRAQFGVILQITGSTDHRWTPFFYGLEISRPRSFGANPATPLIITDTMVDGSHIIGGWLTAGLEPGEGRMSVELLDFSPYPMAVKSGRSGYPVQLATTVNGPIFTGIAKSPEVTPIRDGTAAHRITIQAMDRWEQLARCMLRDQRDWSGHGHIDVIRFMAEQGGVDTSTGEFPAGYVANVTGVINTPLGDSKLAQQTKDLAPAWEPTDKDTPASYIKRIAEHFSGWNVGFRLNGTFFYLPRDYFSTVTQVFTAGRAHAAPYIYSGPTFTTIEPEANVILVRCANTVTGAVTYSSLWVDLASIMNPAAVNFLGWEKKEVIELNGTFGCPEVNRIARTIFTRTRRRIYEVKWESDFLPALKIGQVVTVADQGDYYLTAMHATFSPGGISRCHYTGISKDKGF
jgi:hypothetical protein